MTSHDISATRIRQVLTELVSMPLIGSHRVLATECFWFGDPIPGGRYAAAVALQAECPWEIVCRGTVVASSADFVESEDGVGEEVLEPGPERDSRLKAFFENATQGSTRPQIQEATLLDRGDIEFRLTNDCILMLSISDVKNDGWAIVRDGKSDVELFEGHFSESTV